MIIMKVVCFNLLVKSCGLEVDSLSVPTDLEDQQFWDSRGLGFD